MRQFFVSLLCVVIVSCNSTQKTEPSAVENADTSQPSPPSSLPPNAEISKPDQATCDTTKGLKWSKVLNGCVILIDLVTLHPVDPSYDPNKTAHLAFDSTRVEIFLPTQASSIVIRKSRDGSAVWENGPLKLIQASGKFRLEDEGKPIYQQR